jgi:hypothetical protein
MQFQKLDGLRTNLYLNEKISSGMPFAAGKIGNCELMCIYNYYFFQSKNQPIQWNQTIINEIYKNAGVFPQTEQQRIKFVLTLEKSIENIDGLVSWSNFNREFEARFIKRNNSNCTLLDLEGLEPYYFGYPWTQYLKNKTVLVISPFKKSIESQFLRRNKIWDDNRLLCFNLKTLEFPLSPAINNNKTDYQTWNDLIDAYKYKISNENFDFAIVGVGAASLPLCSFIKSINKQAIHLGGPTQILFGIKGLRWDMTDAIRCFYNENWIRPSEEEKPISYKEIEDGGYW